MDDIIQGPDNITKTTVVKKEEPEEPPWVKVYMDDTLGAGDVGSGQLTA